MGGEFGVVITEREQASAKMSRESCSNERPPLSLSTSKFGSLNEVQTKAHRSPAAYLCRSARRTRPFRFLVEIPSEHSTGGKKSRSSFITPSWINGYSK